MSLIHYKNYKGITLLARDLRKNQTTSERLLWEVLRARKFSGYKFLRQHPIFYRIAKSWVDFYIADFYCNKLKLVIELDGKIHETQEEYDKERDEKLKEKGIQVIRFKNEILNNINDVKELINSIIKSRIKDLADNK